MLPETVDVILLKLGTLCLSLAMSGRSIQPGREAETWGEQEMEIGLEHSLSQMAILWGMFRIGDTWRQMQPARPMSDHMPCHMVLVASQLSDPGTSTGGFRTVMLPCGVCLMCKCCVLKCRCSHCSWHAACALARVPMSAMHRKGILGLPALPCASRIAN